MEAKEIYTEFSEEAVAELEGVKKEYELHQVLENKLVYGQVVNKLFLFEN